MSIISSLQFYSLKNKWSYIEAIFHKTVQEFFLLILLDQRVSASSMKIENVLNTGIWTQKQLAASETTLN